MKMWHGCYMKKKPIDFYFEDYAENAYAPKNLGVYFYDEEILFGWDKDFGRRSYQFRVLLRDANQFDRLDVLFGKKIPDSELLEFIYTCDLKDFTKVRPAYPDFDMPESLELDWDKLISIAIPDRLADAKERLIRKIKGIVPDPVTYESGKPGDTWHVGDEFLHFTDETAWSWAGPFHMGEKKGAAAKFGKNRHQDKSYPVLDVAKYHSRYDLPHYIYTKVSDKDHYHMTPEARAEFFNSLSIADRHHTATKYYNKSYLQEAIENTLPYEIKLFGNDDCSYTKWFATEEEMLKEMDYLRKMQPLHFWFDIRQREYIFTN